MKLDNNSISKKQISKLISKEINETFEELIDLCLSFDESLNSLNFNSVKESLINCATPKEMAQAAKVCGSLKSLFNIANSLNIKLDSKSASLEKWGTLVDIYLDSTYPILYNGKKEEEE